MTITLALAYSLAVGPVIAFSLYALGPTFFSDAESSAWGIIVVGTFAGLVGVWLRLLLPSQRLRMSAVLRWCIAALLVTGCSTAIVLCMSGNPVLLALGLGPLVAGMFLIAATLGTANHAV